MLGGSRLVVWSRRFLFTVAAAFVLLSIDWRPHRTSQPPTVVEKFRSTGALQAGAAKASIVPPFPTPIGGYSTRGNEPFEGVAQPVFARALVVQVGERRIGLVSVELVAVPAPLREKVLSALGGTKLDDVFIGATHTHAGPGGYWNKHIAEWIGLGAYDPKIETFLAMQIAQALRDAAAHLKPARIASGRIEASNYQVNRDDQSIEPDKTMTGIRIDALDGSRIARVIIYAVHPTIMPRDSMKLSGDWPGVMMASLEGDGAPALFFQGAVGDVTWGKRAGEMTQEERTIRFGHAVAGDAEAALAAGGDGETNVSLALARARFDLPPADASAMVWPPFERMASNVMQWLMRPTSTEVSFLRLGPFSWAAIPGEPVTQLGLQWKKALGNPTIVGLMDDYIGYVETPERIQEKKGEAVRSYFGPALAPALLGALQAAQAATER